MHGGPHPLPRPAAGSRRCSCRRARLSALAGGGAFGSGFGLGAIAFAIASLSPLNMTASSNFAIAVRIGTSRGAWGNLSSSMVRWMTAVTAASSASVKSIVGTARIPARRGRGQPLSAAGRAEIGSNARTRTSQEHEPRALGDRRGASALAPTIAPPHDDATPPKWGCARPGVEASAAADPAACRISNNAPPPGNVGRHARPRGAGRALVSRPRSVLAARSFP